VFAVTSFQVRVGGSATPAAQAVAPTNSNVTAQTARVRRKGAQFFIAQS